MDKPGEDIIQGICDLCGEVSDGTSAECNLLSCSFALCSDILYHQACLDKFLRSNKLDKSRKTGFKCPRGCGKESRYTSPCRGRIDKSHPIFPRNETKKNKVPILLEPAPKSKKDKEASSALKKTESLKDSAKALRGTLACTASTMPATVSLPKGQPTKEQLLEAKAAARRDLGLERGVGSCLPAPASKASVLVAAPTGPGAWPKGSVATAALPDVTPASHTLASYPQLAHFMQISSSTKETKQQRAAVAAAAAAAAPSSTPSLLSQQEFPPVLNMGSVSVSGLFNAWTPAFTATADKAPQPGALGSQRSSSSAVPLAPPPPPPRPTVPVPAPATSSAPQAPSLVMEGTVGMDFEVGYDTSKLTKAQRKNLKRAERKNRLYMRTRGGLDEASEDDDDDPAGVEVNPGADGNEADLVPEESLGSWTADLEALRDAERAEVMEEIFVQSLMCRKAMLVLRDVQRLAFTWWQGAAAVQRFGGDLDAGVAWLLECGGAGVEEVAVMPLFAGGCTGIASWPDLDVSEELQSLAEVQAGLGVDAGEVQAAVVEALGDIPRSIELLCHARQPSNVWASSGSEGLGQVSQGASAFSSNGVAASAAAGNPWRSLTMQADPIAEMPTGRDQLAMGLFSTHGSIGGGLHQLYSSGQVEQGSGSMGSHGASGALGEGEPMVSETSLGESLNLGEWMQESRHTTFNSPVSRGVHSAGPLAGSFSGGSLSVFGGRFAGLWSASSNDGAGMIGGGQFL